MYKLKCFKILLFFIFLLGIFFLTRSSGFADDQFNFSAELIAYSDENALREDLNPENIIGIPRNNTEMAALIKTEFWGLSSSVRISGTRESVNANHETNNKIELTKLSKFVSINDSLQAFLGKKNIHLDGGYSFHPLDFFEDNRVMGDFGDKKGKESGFSMVGIDLLREKWQLTLIYSDDFDSEIKDYNRGMKQFLARLRFIRNTVDGSIVLQQYDNSRMGIGTSFNIVPDNRLEIHASGFIRQGTCKPVNQNLYFDQLRTFTFDDPNKPLRSFDRTLYTKLLAGLQWTSDSLINYILEYSYDSSGFSEGQWSDYLQLIDFHKKLPAIIRNQNLARDAASLSMGRQHHLYGRVVFSNVPLKPEISSLIGIDASGWLRVRLTQVIFNNCEMWVDLKYNYGSSNSEFGLVPLKSTTTVGLRYSF